VLKLKSFLLDHHNNNKETTEARENSRVTATTGKKGHPSIEAAGQTRHSQQWNVQDLHKSWSRWDNNCLSFRPSQFSLIAQKRSKKVHYPKTSSQPHVF
jgi:hypothetical protein